MRSTVTAVDVALLSAGYSMIYNPWLCLVFEAMESFTSSLATTAAVTYAATLSTSSTDTSVQGLIGGLYYGVGEEAATIRFYEKHTFQNHLEVGFN